MRKIFYIIAILVSSGITFSCTDEEVTPAVKEQATGGGGSDDKP